MRPDESQELLRRRPFQPLRLHLTDGTIYEIRHPELAAVGRSIAIIQLPAAGYPFALAQQRVIIALIHIVYIDFLQPPVAPSTN